jgi:ATP-dependent DNA helicase DinG
VGQPLSEWVYGNLGTVVMTSATLSVQNSFDYLKNRIGLDRVVDREVNCAQLDSPFDFQEQAMLAIPTDIPTPQEKDFNDVSIDCIREVLEITRGHAFILFTAYGALDKAYRALEGELKDAGITPLRQGQVARTQLLERFRSDTASVLFGTDSFWEGVDVAGDALQCVIVPKLPFRVPTEPIQEARAQAIDESGGNSFMHYTVPQAVIKFRQGIGRLIRRTTDRGALVLLDRRVTTKHYGRVFLESLPEMRVISGPREGAFMALRRFFEEGREEA